MPKPIDPEKLAQLTEKAHRLGQLKDQPGWADLVEIVDRNEKRYYDQQMRTLRNGDTPDPAEVKAYSLTFDLIRYLLAHPEKAEQTLSRAIEKAERLGVLQEEGI